MTDKICLVGKQIPMNVVEPEAVYILLDITPVFGYDSNSVKTDVVVGYTYVVVNTGSFNQYRIKIERPVPLMPRESLLAMRERGERVLVEFENPIVRMYWSSYQNAYADSFRADAIQQVDEEIQLD